MAKVKLSPIFLMSILASALSIFNGVLILLNGGPLVISSFSASSIEEVWTSKTSWSRMVFGIPGLATGWFSYIWMIFPIAMLVMAVRFYLKPKTQKTLAMAFIISSFLSLPLGGGFYIGAFLGVLGGLCGIEWPKPFSDTFCGRLISSLLFKKKVIDDMLKEKAGLQTAAFIVCLIALLAGFAASLYSFNVFQMYSNPPLRSEILIEGKLQIDFPVFIATIQNVGIIFIKWLSLSFLVYLLGGQFIGKNVSLEDSGKVSAFVYVPKAIYLAMPLIFSNEPLLSKGTQIMFLPFSWPLLLLYISYLWSFLIFLYTLTKILDITGWKALGVGILIGTIYWLGMEIFLSRVLLYPGISIQLPPESMPAVLLITSLAFIVATLLGAFKK